MAHNLFGKRFYSHRVPAWHNLGLVLEEELGAVDAFHRIGGYDVRYRPIITVDGLAVPGRALVRGPVADDPNEVVLGVVSEDYTLITPADTCHIWDRAVGKPVETIGSLGRGEELFITTKLPSFDVKGDELDSYLLCCNDFSGARSAEASVVPVRVVCQNTLVVARNMASESYFVRHTGDAAERLAEWLKEIYWRAQEKADALKEVFEILAEHRMRARQAESVLSFTYPFRAEPTINAPETTMTVRRQRWEALKDNMLLRRRTAKELFEGRGTGMDSLATAGTAWGLYNAVVELEDNRIGIGDASKSYNALFGNRAATKERCFSKLMEICRN